MDGIAQQIKSIQDKLQQLLKQQTHLQQENLQLKKQIEGLEADRIKKEAATTGLLNQLEDLKKAGPQWNQADKLLMEKRIDAHLKEIEKCLLLLNA